MRSRTSRVVPEWSGGKDLYMEVLFWSPEKFRAISVIYRDHREGPGSPPSGATCPRRLRGPSVGGDQPLGGLVRPPQGAQGARESGRGQTLVQMGLKAHLVGASPSLPSWPPPPFPI
jgi:hypothetical protein